MAAQADIESMFKKAVQRHCDGFFQEARQEYQTLLDLQPKHAGALHYLGVLLHQTGQAQQAVSFIRMALDLAPNWAQAYDNLGSALIALGHFTEAEEAYQKALDLQPDNSTICYNYGCLLYKQKKIQEAESFFRKTIAIDPTYSFAYNNLGSILQGKGRLLEAAEAYQQAAHYEPEKTKAYNNIGKIFAELGDFLEAEHYFRLSLQINPSFTGAFYSLTEITQFTRDDPLLAQMEALLDQEETLGTENLMPLCLALGKATEQTQDYDTSFRYYAKGNSIKRKTLNYNVWNDRYTFEKLTEFFHRSRMQELAGKGYASEMPVFIVGMPRSGTTLVEQICSSHSAVHGAGEINELNEILASVDAIFKDIAAFPGWINTMPPEKLLEFGKAYIAQLQRYNKTALRITDKNPFNFRLLGFIHLILPQARIIHVRRNPLDICWSCFTTNFKDDLHFSYDLQELGVYYQGYTAMMDHWRNVLPKQNFHEIQYENLVAHCEDESQQLIQFLDLPWEEACLRFYDNQRPVATASNVQVRSPLYSSAVKRWKQYENHLDPLRQALGM